MGLYFVGVGALAARGSCESLSRGGAEGRGWPVGVAVMRSGTCDSTGDESQWGRLSGAPAGSAAPVQPGPAVSVHARGRLGWTRAGAETRAPGEWVLTLHRGPRR